MKKKTTMRFVVYICIFLCAVGFMYAEEKNPWNFSIITDFAYYPESDFIAGREWYFDRIAFSYRHNF